MKDKNRLGKPISTTTKKNIDPLHDMILEDRRIGLRSKLRSDVQQK